MGRANSWLSSSLSFSGRLQLTLSSLFSILVFWCSTLMLLVAIMKECEAILRRFLWHGNGNYKKGGELAWNKVCRPKEEGGLGIKSTRAWNFAAILKHGWEICHKKKSVWTDWCYEVLLKEENFWHISVRSNCFWSWRKILQCRRILAQNLLYEVKNGKRFSLWFDPWLLGESITDKFGMRVIQDSGIPREARVCRVIRDRQWV
ncbi:hypothetical protein CFOL_v3_27185 [Cephalotus follicularis]|uniref:Zf-RVT domain-containing protein n=1 Tax=Cephalotus follicularis TaxID=3775 RepID=A0A1Q3CU18_CEPFO|nr:hypothetical protein CFOL_v3_27185 [Cephalotus follicularis]